MPTLSRSMSVNSSVTKILIVIAVLVFVILLYKYVLQPRFKNEAFEDFAPVTVNTFFMPGCGHCTAFKPEWKKFCENKPSYVKTNEYSSDKNMDKCEEYNVSGFPTIILERDGKREQYNGERTADALTAACSTMASK